MKLSLRSLFTAMALSLAFWSSGQVTEPQFIPPSPNAYSLGKYGDIPVSLYTGVPNISIPIWNLQEHGLSAEVSLSYHGSGIKVDEVASWVGLGFSLNAGGVITRVVRSRAEYVDSDGTLRPQRADFDFYDPAIHSSRANYVSQNELQAMATEQIDTEPDEYYYNFNGRSGKFYFDKNGNAVLYKQEAIDIKLEYVSLEIFKS